MELLTLLLAFICFSGGIFVGIILGHALKHSEILHDTKKYYFGMVAQYVKGYIAGRQERIYNLVTHTKVENN